MATWAMYCDHCSVVHSEHDGRDEAVAALEEMTYCEDCGASELVVESDEGESD